MAKIKFLLSLGLIALTLPSYLDAWRMASREPPIGIQALVKTPFEQLAQKFGNMGDVRLSLSAQNRRDLRYTAVEYLQVEALTALAIPATDTRGLFQNSMLLRLAERISRREPQIEIQLAALAAQRGDIALSLVHIDKMLQVSPALSNTVLPNLGPALADPTFRGMVRKYSRRKWFWELARQASKAPDGQTNTAHLFSELKDEAAFAPSDMFPHMLSILLADGRIESAVNIAVASGKINRSDLNKFSPSLENSVSSLLPLTWKLGNSELSTTVVDRDGWEATIEAGRSAVLFERVTWLGPGDYRLIIPYYGSKKPVLEAIFHCMGNSRNETGQSSTQFTGDHLVMVMRFKVPPVCRLQSWTIRGFATNEQFPLTLRSVGPMALGSQ